MTLKTCSVIGKLLMSLPANGLVSLAIPMSYESSLCTRDSVVQIFTFASKLLTLEV